MNHKTNDDHEYGLCLKSQAHKFQPIQYVCLEDHCQLNRLLCKVCVQESHRKHKVGIIDKLIQPLNRLNMNSFDDKSDENYDFFVTKTKAICDEWGCIDDILQDNIKQLQNGILFQLNAVMKTFTNEEIDRAHEFLINGNQDLDSINEIVKTINFLSKDERLQEVQTVKKFATAISERTTKIINKTIKKIKSLLQKMQLKIKEYDFYRFGSSKVDVKDDDQHDQEEKGQNQYQKKNEEEQTQPIQKKSEKETKEKEAVKQKDQEQTNKYVFSSYNNTNVRKGFAKYK